MQSVTLCDQMTMEEAPQLTLYVRAQGRSFVPADGNNLVLKAAAALQAATGCTRGARITLKKYIPVAAGMGGGSSDAAAALVGLNRLWGLGLSPDKLEEIGLTVGADVPFCIRGGLQRAKGVGEKLTPDVYKRQMSCNCECRPSCPYSEWLHPLCCNPAHFCCAGWENGPTLVIHKIVLEPCGNQSCTCLLYTSLADRFAFDNAPSETRAG